MNYTTRKQDAEENVSSYVRRSNRTLEKMQTEDFYSLYPSSNISRVSKEGGWDGGTWNTHGRYGVCLPNSGRKIWMKETTSRGT